MNSQLTKRLKDVEWKDLVVLSSGQRFIELTITLPWLFLSLMFAHYGFYLLAVPFSFVFFLCGLRQVHNGYHYALGVSKQATNWILWLNSLMMLAAMHAIKHNHLQHHKHCLNDEDVEGKCARMPAIKALLYGPLFPVEQHYHAIKKGSNSTRKWVYLELFSIAILYTLVMVLNIEALQYHLLVMLIGECFTAFFAVWTVHHDCDEEMHSRTIRSRWKSLLTFNMFFHLEHHLYPKVPTINLPELARRIDVKAPDIKIREVI